MTYPSYRKTHKKFRDQPTKRREADPHNLFDPINDEESEEVDSGSAGDAEHDEKHHFARGVRPSDGFHNWGEEEE
tara:strand:+ start:951 stop:1175 length:225 start_codon:yes stop_codon:yes gene_type:complete